LTVRVVFGALKRHDPLTCELCHAEGVGAELASLRAALVAVQKIAAREWAADETNYEWYGDIAGIAEEALGLEIGGSDDGGGA
jgi:hypothetical protein